MYQLDNSILIKTNKIRHFQLCIPHYFRIQNCEGLKSKNKILFMKISALAVNLACYFLLLDSVVLIFLSGLLHFGIESNCFSLKFWLQ